MSKRKLSAGIRVADGAGGLRPVIDQRFDAGPWFAEQVIPAAKAKDWMAHVKAETEERGWNSSGISQIEADENSGSISIRSVNSSSSPTLHFVWEKPRSGDLSVKARLGGTPQMSKEFADSFMGAVRERLRTSATTVVHRCDMLTYEGLAWRGELWLGKNLRLGPPSRFPSSLLGPQVVIVDAMVEGIGRSGIDANFQSILREIQIFLGVVLGIRATLVRPENGWVAEFDDKNHPIDCQLQSVGYWEVGSARTFPVKGDCASVARESVTRPGTGGRRDQQERWVPEDIEELWLTFKRLPKEMNDNFLRAGNAFLNAQSMWPDQKTAYAAFHVVACEALKPIGKRHDRLNIYDVIASLVGIDEAQNLRQLSIKPQKVRSQHFHRGELVAGELLSAFMNNEFSDPSFDEMVRELSRICRICLIEWLRCRGEYKVVRLPRFQVTLAAWKLWRLDIRVGWRRGDRA